MLTLAADGRVVVYSGDDERFEYIYKFVSRGRYNAADRARTATCSTTARSTSPVSPATAAASGARCVTATAASPAPTASRARPTCWCAHAVAADALGATKMDRPEWIAVHPRTKEVYCSLTNNALRGGAGQAPADAANPRANNVFGHIIRWREAGGDPAATRFAWDIFVLAGDPAHPDPAKRGTVKGDGFGSPDGLRFDERGVLWIETDVSAGALNKGDYARLGNNQMLAANVATGEIRRFLVGPANCELTGIAFTPDGRTLFVNIQHPGETPSERSDPANPRQWSNWPDFDPVGRPRSATLAITRDDGGVIGS